MEALMAELAQIVEKEVLTFQRLLESLTLEQKALIQHDIASIEAAVAEQQKLTQHAALLEKGRVRLVKQLAVLLGENSADLTLKRLLERVEGPQADLLCGLRQSLIEIHEQLRQENRNNTLLLRQSMKYVDKSLQLLTGGPGSTGVYAQSGKMDSRPSVKQAMVNQVV